MIILVVKKIKTKLINSKQEVKNRVYCEHGENGHLISTARFECFLDILHFDHLIPNHVSASMTFQESVLPELMLCLYIIVIHGQGDITPSSLIPVLTLQLVESKKEVLQYVFLHTMRSWLVINYFPLPFRIHYTST